ncbi:riboflavin synthase subunit alpha [Inhella gelatinilytica]|uniref:Riboflavin synthase n=1 Tax=Inhella gelatinilytica TaxID=2795030 RepID=A0A931IVE8_9BURK|nr:riboflavin synthase subunit alpha [Inhella gelatinilytica]MBH9552879.1 riboflavin synthase subunit alpha [Inhella gelatinilytica]
MFTGIVQGVATVVGLERRPGLSTLTFELPAAFDDGLAIGASVACDGVCLTVTERPAANRASFDVMGQTLALTTLGGWEVGSRLNVERAAKEGAEIGGHPLSGHVDVTATVSEVRRPDNNHVLRLAVPAPWMRYIFAKGYVGVNGCSLTVATLERRPDGSGWFEVWLIPETLRMTTFGQKGEGAAVHLEIDRATQVVVDTVREALSEQLGPLLPVLERLAGQQGIDLTELPKALIRS